MHEQAMRKNKLEHGMLLDAKLVLDNAMSELEAIRRLVPEVLEGDLDNALRKFERVLVQCDVSRRYEEKS